MGNLFSLESERDPHVVTIINHLKQFLLKDFNDNFDLINQDYTLQQAMDFEDIDTIFGNMLDEHTQSFFLLMQQDKDLEGQVDIYTCIAAMVMCSGEEFDAKLRFMFMLFDFDNN